MEKEKSNGWLYTQADGVYLKIWAQPKAKTTEIAGIYNKLLKIKVAVPPAGGKANKELVNFLSSLLSIPAGKVAVIKGHTSREKLIKIENVSFEKVASRLVKFLQP